MKPWSSVFQVGIAVTALSLAATACAGGDGGGGGDGSGASADASAELNCESAVGEADPVDLRVGHREGRDQSYVEIADGDAVPMVLGYQGFFMLLLEPEAALPVEWDRACMRCAAELGPSSSTPFDGASQSGQVLFEVIDSGAFRGSFTFVVGSVNDRPKFDGAQVTLSMSCSRDGLSGSVERALTLAPE